MRIVRPSRPFGRCVSERRAIALVAQGTNPFDQKVKERLREAGEGSDELKHERRQSR